MRVASTRPFVVALIAALAMLAGSAFSGGAAAANFTANFGELRGDPPTVAPTRSLKLCLGPSGYRFGVLVSPSDDAPYRLKLMLHLPATPKSIGGKMQGSNYGRDITDDQGSKSGPQVISYIFDDGDPLGAWSIDVMVNDAVIGSFPFMVAAAARCP